MDGIRKIFVSLALFGFAACASPHQKKVQDVELEKGAVRQVPVAQPLPHPEKADAWSTEKLIADNANGQPKKNEIEECDLQVTVVSTATRNDQDMIDGKRKLGQSVSKSVAAYHWCFYQAVRVLDRNLANTEMTFEAKGDEFFQTMKALWLLARALELVTNDKHYFTYIQERYIQLNRDVFGRSVIAMVPPIDDRLKDPPTQKPSDHNDE